MAALAMRVLAALLLEGHDLRAALLGNDLRRHRRAIDKRRPDPRRVAADRENVGKSNACALVAVQSLDVENVVLKDPVLFSARADHREHIEILELIIPRGEPSLARKARNIAFGLFQSTLRAKVACLLQEPGSGCRPGAFAHSRDSMAALLDRLYNFHWVTPDVARSAQPYIGFYGAFVGAHGIRSIVNLRGDNPTRIWWRQEKRTADALAIRHYNIRLSSRLIPARASMVELVDAFDDAPRPILIKCSGGQDRTSLAAATYLLHANGLAAFDAAEAQFSLWPYLHRPRQNQKWMRHFPAFARDEIGATRFADWLRLSYDPSAFAAWLDRRGEGKSYTALQRI